MLLGICPFTHKRFLFWSIDSWQRWVGHRLRKIDHASYKKRLTWRICILSYMQTLRLIAIDIDIFLPDLLDGFISI